jgi:preprotein translocase subunit SecD
MMVKKYVAILAVLLLLAAVSLVYGSRALADLSVFDPAANIFETKLILSSDTIIPGNQEIELIEARPIIARRLDRLGLDGPYHLVIRNSQLEVTLPQGQNIPYIASVITSVGEIIFINGGQVSPPVGETVNLGVRSDNRDAYQILFTSREVKEIAPPDTATGQIFYRLTLEPAAADRCASFMAANPESFICMVMDGQVINCSTMYHQTGQNLEILPELSSGSAISMTDLAVFLYSGPLSTRLKVVAD